eukprot:1570482-Prorocentrum_lima.AAC.1
MLSGGRAVHRATVPTEFVDPLVAQGEASLDKADPISQLALKADFWKEWWSPSRTSHTELVLPSWMHRLRW